MSTHLHYIYEYTDVDRAFWAEHLEDWLPKKIVDAHVHVTDPGLLREPPTEEMQRSYWVCEVVRPQSAASLARCYDVAFPGRNVSLLCFGHPSLEYDIDGANVYTSRECIARGWHGLAVCRPTWNVAECERVLDLPGIIGFKPYYAMIGPSETTRDTYIESSIFDFLPHHQFEVLDDRKAWVTMHVPHADRLGHPDNLREIREIRRRYPNIVLVIAHLGRSYTEPHAREGVLPLAGDDGLYWDISAVLNPSVLDLAFREIGPKRLLYGTDNPVFYMRGRRQWQGRKYVNRTSHDFHFNTDRESPDIEARYTLYMYEALKTIKDAAARAGFDRADVEAVFRGNAERLIRAASEPKASSCS